MIGNKGQTRAIKLYLEEGNTLTSMEAFEKFGCTRLSARVKDLRDSGYNIVTIMCEGNTRYGDTCRYAKYRLALTSDR